MAAVDLPWPLQFAHSVFAGPSDETDIIAKARKQFMEGEPLVFRANAFDVMIIAVPSSVVTVKLAKASGPPHSWARLQIHRRAFPMSG